MILIQINRMTIRSQTMSNQRIGLSLVFHKIKRILTLIQALKYLSKSYRKTNKIKRDITTHNNQTKNQTIQVKIRILTTKQTTASN